MRRIILVLVIAAVAAIAAMLTKPGQEDFEAEVERVILDRIDTSDVDAQGDPAMSILLATCKLGRNQCAELLRSLMTIEYSDQRFWSTARISMGNSGGTDCFGVFTRITCQSP